MTDDIVTKYYYAGSQRIAMRKNGTLNFIIGDHLGSTSLVTDSSGTVINQTQYKAWGEERYSSGVKQTGYGYTGQYSYAADFGLHFYNARWYDASLGRFNQPDTIIPPSQGVQAWDRYAYTNNNPLRYTDPTGHWLETAFDVVSLGMTINDIRNEGFTAWNVVSLVTDVAAIALPVVPAGASHLIRAAKYTSKAVNAADTGMDVTKVTKKLSDLGKVIGNIPCSFSAETDVSTLEGAKDIAAIETGDYVFAWNEADGTFGYYEVTDTFSHADEVLTELIVDGEWIETTPEHPFYVEGKGWTPADDLRMGDKIRQADGTTGVVWLKWNVYKTQEMYNLTVDTAHTFFVGEGQWLVHNTCPTTLAKRLKPPTKIEPGVTALGSRDDTRWVAKNLPEIRTLVDVPDWTPKKNIKWLDAAMRRGDEIWLLTKPEKVRPESFYLKELRYLDLKRYRKILNWFD